MARLASTGDRIHIFSCHIHCYSYQWKSTDNAIEIECGDNIFVDCWRPNSDLVQFRKVLGLRCPFKIFQFDLKQLILVNEISEWNRKVFQISHGIRVHSPCVRISFVARNDYRFIRYLIQFTGPSNFNIITNCSNKEKCIIHEICESGISLMFVSSKNSIDSYGHKLNKIIEND